MAVVTKIEFDNAVNSSLQIGDVIYVSDAKDIQVNESSLKGYYADITFENSSNTKTELFAISSEVTSSSK